MTGMMPPSAHGARLTVLFRCDASPQIGFGHLMRCLALAEACVAAGDQVRFLSREDAGARRALERAGREVHWLPASAPLAQVTSGLREAARGAAEAGPVWAVVDSYDHPGEQVAAAISAGALTLALDDLGWFAGHPQVLLNPNLDAAGSWYPETAGTVLLLGASYALLRGEFARARDAAAARARNPVCALLVTLGGSDRANRTAMVLQGLSELPAELRRGLTVEVVLGPGTAHQETIEACVSRAGYRSVLHIGTERMSELLSRADLAVTAAGGTVYEAAALGVPAAMLMLAENQRANLQAFARRGLGISLGEAAACTPSRVADIVGRLIADEPLRRRMSAAGLSAVDGQGPARVREAMAACTQPSLQHTADSTQR